MNEEKKLVIFDFDGVLVNTLSVCYSLNAEVNKDLSLEEYKNFFQRNIHDAVRYNGEPRKPNPNVWERYEEGTREVKIPEILVSSLRVLSRDYILAIVSSSKSELIARILERDGCNFFQDILGTDIHKNKTKKNKLLLEKYEILPKDAVYITDTVGDVLEARGCDIQSIAVTWGWHSRETLEKGNPLTIIDDPRELLGTIKSVLK